MKTKDIRNWLGLYFLLITAGLGGYIIIFPKSILLPLSPEEATNAFQIIIPVLVAQLITIFKWYGDNRLSSNEEVDIPTWVIKAPPLIVLFLIVILIIIMVLSEIFESIQAPSSASFKMMVTFCVTILNATSSYIVLRFFNPKS